MSLQAEAAAQPVPTTVTPKDPKDYRLIGTFIHRIDSIDKTDGAAIYALDIRRPNALIAVVMRPPRFGGQVKSVDAAAAKAVKGVVDVVTIPQGVAVLAQNTWAANKGREALKVEWDDSKAEMRSTADMLADYKKLAAAPGALAVKAGDADQALKGSGKVVEAEFVFPYLAHAPMEPLNCTVEKAADGGYDFYAGSQFPTVEQATTAAILGVRPEQVRIHTVWAGWFLRAARYAERRLFRRGRGHHEGHGRGRGPCILSGPARMTSRAGATGRCSITRSRPRSMPRGASRLGSIGSSASLSCRARPSPP